jgi:hypothetical protein
MEGLQQHQRRHSEGDSLEKEGTVGWGMVSLRLLVLKIVGFEKTEVMVVVVDVVLWVYGRLAGFVCWWLRLVEVRLLLVLGFDVWCMCVLYWFFVGVDG